MRIDGVSGAFTSRITVAEAETATEDEIEAGDLDGVVASPGKEDGERCVRMLLKLLERLSGGLRSLGTVADQEVVSFVCLSLLEAERNDYRVRKDHLSLFPQDDLTSWGTNFTVFDGRPPSNGANESSGRAMRRFGESALQAPSGNFEIGQLSYKFDLLR